MIAYWAIDTLLPIFAFILKIFYFRRGRFSHHLVFSFYFFSFLFTVFSILVLTNLIWKEFPGSITTLIIFSTFFYLYLAVKRFYEQGWFVSFLKTGFVTFTFLIFVLPLALIIMGLMAFFFYWSFSFKKLPVIESIFLTNSSGDRSFNWT